MPLGQIHHDGAYCRDHPIPPSVVHGVFLRAAHRSILACRIRQGNDGPWVCCEVASVVHSPLRGLLYIFSFIY